MLFIVFFGSFSQAKSLYVDSSSGNDSVSYAANSATNPWRTVERAAWGSTSINSQNSSQAAQAGDTVHVAAGTYNTTATTGERYIPVYNPSNSGTASSPITFIADGIVRLTSTGGGDGQPIIGTYRRDHIIWDGFVLDEAQINTKPDTGPVVVWESVGVTIQNLTITGFNSGWVDNHNGIRLEYADLVTVRNNTISEYREPGNGMNASAITTYHTQRATIENNTIDNVNTGIFIKGVNDGPVTIRYNLVSNTNMGILFGGIGLSGQMSHAYQNIVVDAALAGIAFNGYDSITPGYVSVTNNTIARAGVGSDGGGILLRPGYSGYHQIYFRNNVVVDSVAGVTAWGSDNINANFFAYNNYYNNTRTAWISYNNYSLSAWQSSFNHDTQGSRNDNPQFTNGYHLSPSSTLLNAGLDVLDLDKDGSTSDQVNMGAYVTGTEIIGRNGYAPPPGGVNPPDSPSGISLQQVTN